MEVSKHARWSYVSEITWPLPAPANPLNIQPLPLASRREVLAIERMGRHVTVPQARSARNIADWSSYLPADCVTRMVALGWHQST